MRQVSVNSLKMGDILGKTIFSSTGRVLLGKGVKLTPLYIAKLRDMGISILYIEDDRFDDVIVEDVISEEHRREAMEILEKSTRSVRLGKDLDGFDLKRIINKIVEEILFKKDILVNMMDMRSLDNQMFAHSVNVCVLSTILGKALMLDREKLETLAIGAIMHDFGKIHLDPKLISKVDLTEEEIEVLKTHTILGFEDLRKRKDLNLVVAHIAFQHHEHINGTGYPRRLKEGEIHPLAQIVAIADLYDKLTSDHSNVKRIMPYEACEILMGLAGVLYPLEMIRIFLKNIAAYPTGVTVRLNTGEIGVVVDQNLSMPARPIVRVFDESEFGSNAVKEYNMVGKRTIFIQEVLS
ncbi:HD-GYP domain-containing protein [Desulfosporosinus hippei]|uniref:HD-GYP domain, c-di-GMP phosphodiesterase class II (Or its inactivated variant) n=1 Tax=Desulfosporosinus hippei DSM 8344 TaxID=1121419 RepID=A0A1G7XUC7_9FIRM|nr:HD-GYP domain-containing protein [Desulfosporosinus hippei]SDG87754.1 HD-GYP domain, c-di-GMP phosphodiesterase class II (or its inactivated variant) [Desulfosporosinus hippei DSM 8344]